MPIGLADLRIVFGDGSSEELGEATEVTINERVLYNSHIPYFTIPEQGWGTGWEAGESIDLGHVTWHSSSFITEEQSERFREALESVDLEQVVQRWMTRIMAEDIDKLFTPVPKSFTHFRGVRKLKL